MRGEHDEPDGMWSYISAERRVPADHPLRPIRRMVDEILERLSPRLGQLYSRLGRPSIPPEHLLTCTGASCWLGISSSRSESRRANTVSWSSSSPTTASSSCSGPAAVRPRRKCRPCGASPTRCALSGESTW